MSYTLTKVDNIPIRIHWSFTLLLVVAISAVSFQSDLENGLLYGIGIIALFASVAIHELVHSLVAKQFGFETDEILLYPLGGMSKIRDMPTNPKHEFAIAFFGPITNFVIALIAYWLSILMVSIDFVILGRSFVELLELFAILNVGLGLFNLILPAIPMDGGRILRSILATQMPYPRATQISVSVSKVLAVIMGIVGFFVNFWLLIIALFVYVASNSEFEQSLSRYILADVSIEKVMSKNIEGVDSNLKIDKLLEKMLNEGHTGYVVKHNGEIIGLVTLADVSKIEPQARNTVKISDIMTRNLITIDTSTKAIEALRILQQREIGRLFVSDGERLIGIVTRSDLIQYMQIVGVKEEIFSPQYKGKMQTSQNSTITA